MKIDVQERHIREGLRAICEHCPVALALRDALQVQAVVVTTSSWWAPGQHWAGRLPYVASAWIQRFDRGDPVKPFTFKLRVP